MRTVLAARRLVLPKYALYAVLGTLIGGVAAAQDFPRGAIIDDVPCQADASQHYALYLPSNYTTSRQWPVILAFDAGGKGRSGLERYRAAAEKYGYIVAGSNNARNGYWDVSLEAAAAMGADVKKRFPVDPKRVYTAGMSGGARVAIMVALNSPDIAGVLASSAGYADEFHPSVRFPLFGSYGTEDFNYREMRSVDQQMTSPHRIEMFEGGHVWLPVELATYGVEWMELLAMKAGLRPRDEQMLSELFAKRMARAEAQPGNLEKMRELKQIADDFDGLKDVTTIAASADALGRQKDVFDALIADRAADSRELQINNEMNLLLRQLSWLERHDEALARMKTVINPLVEASRDPKDSPERRLARRTLATLRSSSRGVPYEDFLEWLKQTQSPAQAPDLR